MLNEHPGCRLPSPSDQLRGTSALASTNKESR